MSVVEELIRKEDNGTLSFGNYLLDTKTKKADFPFEGASYKIKTFNEITRLEKNGTMVYESVPGSAVTNFRGNKEVAEFEVEAAGDISFTLEMEPSTEYKLCICRTHPDESGRQAECKPGIGRGKQGKRQGNQALKIL